MADEPPLARVWLVDKPAGPTSHDVIAGVRRRLPRGVKVGHAGTLDPFATGLLLVLVGRATRLARYLVGLDKTYRAEVVLGARSESGDPEGPISPGSTPPPAETVRSAVAELPEMTRQRVPALSAVRVDGERLYRRTRRGEQAERPERDIAIRRAQVCAQEPERVEVELRVGSGTYVRQIAVDLGERLGCGGYCGALRRTVVGDLALADAVEPDQVEPDPDGGLDAGQALAHLPQIALDAEQARRVGHGMPLEDPTTGPAVLTHDDRAVAVARGDGEQLAPEVVLR